MMCTKTLKGDEMVLGIPCSSFLMLQHFYIALIFHNPRLFACAGFLPEAWDKFFVKYLYPSFTPTVFLFVGGTVAYGVFKYLQGEEMKN